MLTFLMASQVMVAICHPDAGSRSRMKPLKRHWVPQNPAARLVRLTAEPPLPKPGSPASVGCGGCSPTSPDVE